MRMLYKFIVLFLNQPTNKNKKAAVNARGTFIFVVFAAAAAA